MNRRSFIQLLSSILVFKTSNSTSLVRETIKPLDLYGIPYHENNAMSGTWMGIERSTYPQFKNCRAYNNGNVSR